MQELETEIRQATTADAEQLSRLSSALFPLGCPANTAPEDIKDYIDRELTPEQFHVHLRDPHTAILVAGASGGLAGYAMLARGRGPDPLPAACDCELKKFYIDAAYHGRGVAHSLMREVLALAGCRGAHSLWLTVFSENPRAISFYKRWGFRIAGSQLFMVGADAQRDYLMLRQTANHDREDS